MAKRLLPHARGRTGARRAPSTTDGKDGRAVLEREALAAFRLIVGSARAHDMDVKRVAGYTGSQIWALAEIVRSPGLTVNELAECLSVHQSTASNLVNALVERRALRRERDARDQRFIRLHATVEGRKALLRAPGPYDGILVDALRQLSEEQLGRLLTALAAVLARMRRLEPGAARRMIRES